MALKRLGFSIDEMRQITMKEFIAITDLAVGPTNESPKNGTPSAPRKATQADIDKLLG